MKNKKKVLLASAGQARRGFTLIELLVVIAIIGILSSVVLISVGSSRNKAKDATIKADLATVRAQAEIYANDNNNAYTGMCAGDSTIKKIVADHSAICSSDATSYCIHATMHSSTKKWCVDSLGNSGEYTTGCNASNVCTQ